MNQKKTQTPSISPGSEANSNQLLPVSPEEAVPPQKRTIIDGLMDQLVKIINDADEREAAERAETLREKHPNTTPDELIEILIQTKCLQAGAIGAVTSTTSMIPGLGTLASLTFGMTIDLSMTFKLQAELILEIAAAYDYHFAPSEKRRAILLVTGVSTSTNHLLNKAGEKIAQKATERLAQKSVAKAIPVIGVAASGGTNILATYLIGQRAKAYFKLGPEDVKDWRESLRAISGFDERQLIIWLTETTENSWALVNSSAKNATNTVIVAGRSVGELTVKGVGMTGHLLTNTTKTIGGLGQKTGEGIVSGTVVASSVITGAGKTVVETVGNLGKKTGENVVLGIANVAGVFKKNKDEAAAMLESTEKEALINGVLLIIDVQKGFDDPKWGKRNNSQAEENIAKLLAFWRETNRPIYHVQHVSTESDSPLRPDQEGCDFKDAVRPLPHEPVVQKNVHCAFINTNLEELLRQNEYQTLVVVGLTTSHCVSTTTRVAANLGFKVYVVADATAAFDQTDHEGKYYKAKDVYDISLANLHQEFATIINTDPLLALLQQEQDVKSEEYCLNQ